MPEKCNLQDRLPTGVWWNNGSEGYGVGMGGVTGMLTIEVPGQMAYVPWIEVYKGEKLIARVNCAAVEFVTYT